VTVLHARWRLDHQRQPVTVRTRLGIDGLINALLAGPSEHPLAADLTIDPSIPPGLPPSRPGPQLLIGVDAHEQFGSARLTLHGDWYVQGNAAHDGTGCFYHLLVR
jgi:hypothetical protein